MGHSVPRSRAWDTLSRTTLVFGQSYWKENRYRGPTREKEQTIGSYRAAAALPKAMLCGILGMTAINFCVYSCCGLVKT